MSSRNLEYLFNPKSVAVIAEPGEPGCYPEVALLNLGAGNFKGLIIPIDVKKHSLFGISGKPRIGALDAVPELAITCTPLEDVPRIVAQLGALGTKAVIVGPARIHPKTNVARLRTEILEAARPTLMRVLGPGSGGIIIPALGLNASVAPVGATPGKIALVTQSAAIAAAVLDRAATKGVGFSTVLHLGNSVDVDLADALDWLATDPATEAILVQFDDITGGRKFMSAARAAARNKPVVAIRSRDAQESTGGTGDTGGTDQIYEAAMHRAGWVRIETLEGLFEATEALARIHPPRGEKLSILANGRGLGHIAANSLLRSGGRLATFANETQLELKRLLKTGTPLTNPVALPADIKPTDWAAALSAVLADPQTDAVLTIQSPTAFNDSADVASALCEVAKQSDRNIFTCWVGGASVHAARQVAADGGLLSFDAPEKATLVFQRIVSYARNRALLLEMPPSQSIDFAPDEKAARSAVAEALVSCITSTIDMPERLARKLLQAYRIAGLEPVTVASIERAVDTANNIGFPVDLELVLGNTLNTAPNTTTSPAILNIPLSVQGLRSAAEITIAARGLRSRARAEYPAIRVSAYRLRPSGPRSSLPPLRLGTIEHPVFGPIIYLGQATRAGHATAHSHPCAVALPPLNPALARDLIARAGIADDLPDAESEPLEATVCAAIVSLSQLLTDIDEVASIELNPLHVEASGVVALKAQIGLTRRDRHQGYRRFAIRPYPKELEQEIVWDGHPLQIRPIRPEDETSLSDLISSLDINDARMRFFGAMRQLPRSQLARFTQIDYDREMALVAIEQGTDGSRRCLGEVRVVADPDNHTADFAIVVRSGIKGKGLGRLLMQNIIDYAKNRGIAELRGETFAENLRMQRLSSDLGFSLAPGDGGTIKLHLDLKPSPAA